MMNVLKINCGLILEVIHKQTTLSMYTHTSVYMSIYYINIMYAHRLGQKKLIISFSGPAALHFHMPHLSFYSVN